MRATLSFKVSFRKAQLKSNLLCIKIDKARYYQALYR